MPMMEDKAKEKWCPFVRHFTGNASDDYSIDPAANRWGKHLNPNPCRCIASDCMAWRWQLTRDGWASASGYCGLAGTPLMAG